MLRWCLSTVRSLGGHGSILRYMREPMSMASNAYALAAPSNNEASFRINAESTHREMTSNNDASQQSRRQDTPASVSGDDRIRLQQVLYVGQVESSAVHCGAAAFGHEERDVVLVARASALDPPPTFESRPASVDEDTAAIEELHAALSAGASSVDALRGYTPNRLRSLYISAKTRDQLDRLGPDRFSILIGLFGTLSLHPARHSIYTNPSLLSITKPSTSRSYWPFVVTLARDKEQLSLTLTHSDRYWVMRAELASVARHLKEAQPNQPALSKAMARARTQYRHLRHHTADPEVHVPYLETLLAIGQPPFIEAAVYRMCDALRRHARCHPRLVAVLWRVVSEFGPLLSRASREMILGVVWQRVSDSRGVVGRAASARDGEVSPVRGHYTPVSRAGQLEYPIDVIDLADILKAFVFSDTPTAFAAFIPDPDQSCRSWIYLLTQSAFSTDLPLEIRWKRLMFLALYDAPTGFSIAERARESQDLWATHWSTWEVVFGLATLHKTLREVDLVSSLRTLDGARSTALTLWDAWISKARPLVDSLFTIRPIMTSFFRVAALLGDERLRDACRSVCVTSYLLDVDEGRAVCRSQVMAVVAEYIAASIHLHKSQWEADLLRIDRILPEGWYPISISTAIRVLVKRNVDHAELLARFALENGMQLVHGSLSDLAVALVGRGSAADALALLKNASLSPEQRRALVADLLPVVSLRSEGTVLLTLADSLRETYETLLPSQTSKTHLQRVLLKLCASQHSEQAVHLVRSMTDRSPAYFKTGFFLRFLQTLLRSRRFRDAAQLYELLLKVQPSYASKMRSMVIKGLMMGNASRLARRAHRATSPSLPGVSPVLQLGHAIRYQLHHPSPALSLKVSSKLNKMTDDRMATRLALQILVNAGRTRAAKTLFIRLADSVDAKTRTAMGNMILHSITVRRRPRNGRMMRQVLAFYNTLVQRYTFVPDRVTLNILLKAYMRWKKVIDHLHLRALFDRVVRSGYPSHTQTPGRHLHLLPFGTRLLSSSSLLSREMHVEMPLKMPSVISFERHVRPLYRMFVQAFYVRRDVEGARMVIEILKMEEGRERERRERERERGRCRSEEGR